MKKLMILLLCAVSPCKGWGQEPDSTVYLGTLRIKEKTQKIFFSLKSIGIRSGISYSRLVSDQGSRIVAERIPAFIFPASTYRQSSGSYTELRGDLGYHFSVQTDLRIFKCLSLQTELSLTEKNVLTHIQNTAYDSLGHRSFIRIKDGYRTAFLEAPLLIKITVGGYFFRPYFLTGFSGGFKVYSKEKFRITKEGGDPNAGTYLNKAGYPANDSAMNYPYKINFFRPQWVIGSGMTLGITDKTSLLLDIRYTLDLNRNFTISNNRISEKGKFGVVMISTGLVYDLNTMEKKKYFKADKKLKDNINRSKQIADPSISLNHIAISIGGGRSFVNVRTRSGKEIFNSTRGNFYQIGLTYLRSVSKKLIFEAGGTLYLKNYMAYIPRQYSYWLENISTTIGGKFLYKINIDRNLKYYAGLGLQAGWHFKTEGRYNLDDTTYLSGNSNTSRDYIVVNNKFEKPTISNIIESGILLRFKNNQILKAGVSVSFEYVFRNLTAYTYASSVNNSVSRGEITASPFSYGLSLSYTFTRLGK